MSAALEVPQTDEQAEPRSPYWLKPGIDVPFRHPESVCPRSEARRMFFIDTDAGEGGFVPTKSFMNKSPLWRLDVVQDIINDLKLVQEHATVDLFRDRYRRKPGYPLSFYMQYFEETLQDHLGVTLTEQWRELLRLDYEEVSRQAGATQSAGKAASGI